MGGWKTSGMGQRHGAAGHPQVRAPAVAADHAARAQEGHPHVPVQGAHHGAARPRASSCSTGAASATSARRASAPSVHAEQLLELRHRRSRVAVLAPSPSRAPAPAGGCTAGRRRTRSARARRRAARRRARTSRAPACGCPISPEITTPSNSSAKRRAVVARVPHEFDTSPVRMPARAARRARRRACARRGRMPANRRSIRPSAVASPSSAAKRASNSASLDAPASRSRRAASRAARVLAEQRRARCRAPGPRRGRTRANESKTLVVRTPPKSTSRPSRGHAPLPCAIRHARSASVGHALLEQVEERVVGRAREAALVGALEEDRGLPQRQRHVPAHVGHRAARARLVARDQLLAGREARAAGEAAERRERGSRRRRPAPQVAIR